MLRTYTTETMNDVKKRKKEKALATLLKPEQMSERERYKPNGFKSYITCYKLHLNSLIKGSSCELHTYVQ